LGAFAALAISFIATGALAESAQEQRKAGEAQIPVCSKKLGSLAVKEPERNWWSEYGLGSPEALIKVFVQKSHCFTLVDRGKGLAAASEERALASGGELRQGSNMGKGQIKAADYVLIPDLVSQNRHAGGNSVGGMLGGFLPGVAGAGLGGIDIKKKTADVVLTVTDVRSLEQVAMEEGHADKTDIGWGAGGGLFSWGGFGAAGATGYADTEIGQVITLAYLDAYTKLVNELGGLPQNASAASAQQAVTMAKPGVMYKNASQKGGTVRKLDAGMMLYPTGNKEDPMWEVTDELGHTGWVSSYLFDLAK
jgi:curli biogenesis system outer membrane secretion channel CsgG